MVPFWIRKDGSGGQSETQSVLLLFEVKNHLVRCHLNFTSCWPTSSYAEMPVNLTILSWYALPRLETRKTFLGNRQQAAMQNVQHWPVGSSSAHRIALHNNTRPGLAAVEKSISLDEVDIVVAWY